MAATTCAPYNTEVTTTIKNSTTFHEPFDGKLEKTCGTIDNIFLSGTLR